MFVRQFRDSLKQELKLLKQEIDLQPKDRRKDEFRKRRSLMDTQHEDKERAFLSSLSENHELALRRLSEKHRDRLAAIDKSFLQQKQTVSQRNGKEKLIGCVDVRPLQPPNFSHIFCRRLCAPERQCCGSWKNGKSTRNISWPSDTLRTCASCNATK